MKKYKSLKSLLEFPKVNINSDDFDNLLGKKMVNYQGLMRSINCSLNCTFGCRWIFIPIFVNINNKIYENGFDLHQRLNILKTNSINLKNIALVI